MLLLRNKVRKKLGYEGNRDKPSFINEGDYEDEYGEDGGSRGFTIFNKDGQVEFESAESFEQLFFNLGKWKSAFDL
jgi:hypothetical protein